MGGAVQLLVWGVMPVGEATWRGKSTQKKSLFDESLNGRRHA